MQAVHTESIYVKGMYVIVQVLSVWIIYSYFKLSPKMNKISVKCENAFVNKVQHNF